MNGYTVRPFRGAATVDVPPSKSLLCRALLLAALSPRTVRLFSVSPLCEDAETMLGCLTALGIVVRRGEDFIEVEGCGGRPPVKTATLDLGNAGTAARFLPVALAFCGGRYTFTASPRMQDRPMEWPSLLTQCGATVTQSGTPFPCKLLSAGLTAHEVTVDTEKTTQTASGFLLAAPLAAPFRIRLTGGRTDGSYLKMTLSLLSRFGVKHRRTEDGIEVLSPLSPQAEYRMEKDLSAAAYFCALALLTGSEILIRGARKDQTQGDLAFLRMLEERGLLLAEREEGLFAKGTVSSFRGFDEDFRDCADQVLTAAALAPFASTPSRIRNVGHIRGQECDRLAVAVDILTSLGGTAKTDGNDLEIFPSPLRGGKIRTYGDHRVAMAFSLIGLKQGGITVEDPACCAKTFPGYFRILDQITQ